MKLVTERYTQAEVLAATKAAIVGMLRTERRPLVRAELQRKLGVVEEKLSQLEARR